ncbi:ATP-dependent endonuclease [bacterium]|nr:ATP-dependent endonuclease [bacterium]
MTCEEIVFRKPDVNELFVAALRQLAFEEPVSRFARMRKTVVKQCAKNPDSKPFLRSIESNYLSLAKAFGQIFGPQNVAEPSLSQILSLAIALDDLRVYSETALTIWYQQFQQYQPISTESHLNEKMQALLALLGNNRSPAAKAWLHACFLAAIDWRFSEWASLNQNEKKEDLERVLLVQEIFYELKAEGLAAGHAALPLLSVEDLADKVYQCAKKLAGKLRPNLLLLVEGQTEAIVLPHFAHLSGFSFGQLGVEVIASGGAKQVARRYLTIKDTVRLPIVCVLDGDAEQSAELIEDSLRDCDQLVSLAVVELEDCYSYEQLLYLLDEHLARFGQTLAQCDFALPESGRRKDALNKIYRDRGLGDFDKIGFAQEVVQSCNKSSDVPLEMAKVVDAVRATLSTGHSLDG